MALTTEPVVSATRAFKARLHRLDVRANEPLPAADAAVDQIHEAAGVRRRGWGHRYAGRLLISDIVALLVASLVIHIFRFTTGGADDGLIDDAAVPHVALTSVVVVIWLLALTWFGSRDPKAIGYGATEYKRVTHATFAVFGALAIVSFLFKLGLPRSYLLVMMPLGLLGLIASRFVWRRWLRRQRFAGKYLSNVLAVGNAQTVTELLRDLRHAPEAGYRVIGVCISQPNLVLNADGEQAREIDGVPILGGFDDVPGVVRSSGADTVAVTSSASFGPSRVRKLSWELEDTNAELILAPALTNIAGPRVHNHPVAGLPLIHVDRPTYHGANHILKKSFDIVGSLALIVLFAPILLGFAAAIKLTSKGPVFFRQDRVGINGEIFKMIKFRSMVLDAETRLAKLQGEQHDAGNLVLFKMRNDPRITKIGKFIRRFSIDELPQLFNVVMGNMSLVGPRPPLKAEVELYGDDARRRLLVKPGMTGLWQVSGRSDLTWDDTVRLDLYYVENWSITGDLVIIWKTAKAVVSSAGAY
jgi:exopolysaccharide biosynthesis polyprenyl glycosylphosphotransferase